MSSVETSPTVLTPPTGWVLTVVTVVYDFAVNVRVDVTVLHVGCSFRH